MMRGLHVFLWLLFVILTRTSGSQPVIIDSVVISRCESTPGNSLYKSIDSIDVRGLIVSRHEFMADTNGMPDYQTSYTYSATKKPLSIIRNSYAQSTWTVLKEEHWLYDTYDSLVSYNSDDYNSGLLSSSVRDLFGYDLLNRTTTHTHQTYSVVSGLWENEYRWLVNYDSSGKASEKVLEFWINGSLFVPGRKEWIFYLPNDSIEYISSRDYSESDSVVFYHTYNSQGFLENILEEVWTPSGLSYQIRSSTNYYDSSQRIFAAGTLWNVVYWEPCDTTSYVYDTDDRLIFYSYSGLGTCGRGGNSVRYVFDVSGSLDSTTKCNWTQGSSQCFSCAHEFHSLTADQAELIRPVLKIWPNPVRDVAVVELKEFLGNWTWTLYNVLGQRFQHHSEIEDKQLKVDMNQLETGVYFYQITIGERFSAIGKLIVN